MNYHKMPTVGTKIIAIKHKLWIYDLLKGKKESEE